MRQDGLETAAEVAEVVPALVHLDALPVVLDLREHAVRALLHRVLDGLAGLGLGGGKEGPGAQQGRPEALGTSPRQDAEALAGLGKAGRRRV